MYTNVIITSDKSIEYNCFAWAANETRWWGFDEQNQDFWPDDVPKEETLEAYIQIYSQLGYEVCDSGSPEEGYQKIAIYVEDDETPSHAARYNQKTGKWASKLGTFQDVEHELAERLIIKNPQIYNNKKLDYGRVAKFMRRRNLNISTR